MGGDAPSPPANTTTVSSTTPWAGVQPYLIGTTGSPASGTTPAVSSMPGLFSLAGKYASNYQNLNPAQQSLNSGYGSTLANRQSGYINGMQQTANDLMNGGYDTNIAGINMGQTRQSQGALDPTSAYAQMLSGTPNNPYLQQMQQANINTSMRGYNDAIQNFNQQTMPGIQEQAFADGGYGGSRQGIAQGLAMQQMQRNARDLGISAMDAGNQLYGSAYENAQGRMQSAADTLSGQGLQNAQFNANLATGQAKQSAQNAQAGIQSFTNAFGQADNTYNQQQAILQAPQIQAQNALNQYANLISPGSAWGNSSQQQSIPIYQQGSTLGNVIGGLSTGLGLLGSFG